MALHCNKLQKLSLAENPITDRSIRLINSSSFPRLTSLNLRRCTELSSPALVSLVTTLKPPRADAEDDYFKQEIYDENDTTSIPCPDLIPVDQEKKTEVSGSNPMQSLDLWGVLGVYDNVLEAISGNFPHLRQLWLGETAITDEGLVMLAQSCTELQEISLRRCNSLTDAGIIPLLQANPSLQRIDLWVQRLHKIIYVMQQPC